ncbi:MULTISPECIES: GTP cyclohydrolase II [Bacillaceae]|uniref:GTP cyclohydrolase II n=1 Tax=Metabacillus endolithicus TaxID=1535204 RepID=A0ABW5C4C2_9BACI|nr:MULTISPECIES: GTP cyclohydrolase II [Bacillaceae]PGT82608.1 GTP cyclohydrolase [Bacillus sp. AFS040349]UGB31177.1 GTP cyclohydrolase II [Metabacillus sp. B2-18]UPG61859.1 GTP cyclohydrolase II [Metabacillus endolithicus]
MVETIKDIPLNIIKEKVKIVPHKEGATYIVGPINLPIQLDGKTEFFKWYCWMEAEAEQDSAETFESIIRKLPSADLAKHQQSSVLVYGDFAQNDEALIRMHSICHTGDIFGSKRCDCGYQLNQSLKMITEHGTGALFYLADHEGRGIGLFSKALAYLLQEEGLDTVEANEELGFSDDQRKYDDAIRVLKTLRQLPVTLITNNPLKLKALQDSGANVTDRIPLWGDVSSFNQRYLETKMEKAGHFRGGYTVE